MQTPDRIDRIEEAIVRLTDNQETQAEISHRLQRNQEYMDETHRMMAGNITRITETLADVNQTQQRITTNIRDVIWLLDKVVDRIAKTEQRHAEQDERFNILLQEIRASNRRIDNLEAQ